MRIILFTGKGGSGVSTVAAATAVAAAHSGRRTLAFGLGGGLGAAFASPLGVEPKLLAPGLQALETEGRRRPDAPDAFRDWLGELMDWRGMDVSLAADLSALPGLNLVGRLLEVEAFTQQEDLDLLVVDGPPLGQFLDLLAALDAAARWLERLFPPRQPTVFQPFLRAISGYVPTGEDVYEHGRDLLRRLVRLRDLLTDRETSSVRLVLGPDQPALAEAQQALATLGLFAYPVDAAAVNRLLPPEVADPFFGPARSEQEAVLRYIAGSLGPVPVLSFPLAPEPPRGVDALSSLAAALYGRHNPLDVLYHGPVHAFSQQDGRHVLSLALPFARREDVSLEQDGNALIVHLGGRQRTVPLPQEVRDLQAASSSFDGQSLTVTFGR